MAHEDLLEALAPYGAEQIAIDLADGAAVHRMSRGGSLADAFERLGRGRLKALLGRADVRRVRLSDGDLAIEASRAPSGARIRVAWGADVVVDEAMDVRPAESEPVFRPDPGSRVTDLRGALHDPTSPLYAVREADGAAWYGDGRHGPGEGALPLLGTVPAVDPASLGSAAFREAHGLRLAYVAGAMAGGIASVDLVLAMARGGLLGFYGAGGVPLPAVDEALGRLAAEAGEGAWGANLLHNPAEPSVEEGTVDLFLKHGVRTADASAYMTLTPAVVRYRLAGIRRGADGRIEVPNRLFAKVSRPEVAERFLRPAPDAILAELKARGVLTDEQIGLARQVPVADDVTGEADSGGHTDRRPLVVMIPILQALRDRIVAEEGYAARGIRPRIGAAGGIGTPASAWAAFAMGADYVMTGSINQAAREAGTSDLARQMLAEASFTDVETGPAPDMFELGAQVQVLSRGSMYARRAKRLYEIYREFPSMDAIPADERDKIEKQLFRRPLAEVWEGTRSYWQQRDPREVARAEKDPRHQMALTFRWYLGMTSRWARTGDVDRQRDFQMWCGPAMGGFNAWAKGTALEALDGRSVVAIADALMRGAAAHARVTAARAQGLPLPDGADAVGFVE